MVKMPHLEITQVVLVYCNTASNGYKLDSRVFYKFVTNKSITKFKNFIFLKTF